MNGSRGGTAALRGVRPLGVALATGLGLGWALSAGVFVGHAAFAGRPWPLTLAASVVASLGLWLGLDLVYRRVLGPQARWPAERLPWAVATMVAAVAGPMLIDVDAPYVLGGPLGKLYPLVALGLACRVWLPRETSRVVSAALDYPRGRRIKPSWLLFPVPVIFATEVVVAAVTLGDPTTDIRPAALLLTSITLLALFAVLLALSNRTQLAGLATTVLYVLFAFASSTKLAMLLSPISLLDAIYVPELWKVYSSSVSALHLGAAILVVAPLAAIAKRTYARRAPAFRSWSLRLSTLVLGAASLVGVAHLAYFESTREALRRVGVETHTWGSRGSSYGNGLLVEALLATEALHVPRPEGYSRHAIADILARRGMPTRTPALRGEPIDLIVYMVEAFWDPSVLGLPVTRDPIPTFRRLAERHGASRAVSPVFGGLSCNSELEALTGLSMSFMPRKGTPAYSFFIRRDVPSLPRELSRLGYTTHAIHVEGLWFQGRSVAYGHLGFDTARSLRDQAGVKLDAAGRVAADSELVDAIIETTVGPTPKLVFAFPNSTHMPWDYPAYESSDLDVAAPMPASERGPFKTYLNALHAADQAIGKLVAHYERSPRKTLILILGDHLPVVLNSLAAGQRYLAGDDADALARRFGANAVLWSNFERPAQPFTASNNFLPTLLLEALGVEPSGYLGLLRALREEVAVIGAYVEDARGARTTLEHLTPAQRQLLRDYRLLQHDVLFGERYLDQLVADARVARVAAQR